MSFRFSRLPLFFAVSFLLFAFPFSVLSKDAGLSGPSVEESFQQGKEFYLKHQYTEAEKLFRRCISLDPHNADYRCWLAQSLAFIMAEQAMQGVSTFSLIPSGKAIRELYKEALEVDPKNERALVGYSTLLRDIPGWLGGDVKQAETILKEVLAKNPDNVFALHNLGTLYIRKKEDYQTGLTYLKKAVELKEKRELTQEEIFKLSNTFHAIGETYFENLNQPAAALPYLENSYAIAPDNVVTMLDLVSVYAEVKQETKAKEMLMKAYAFATERQYKHFYGDIKKAAKKLGLKKEIQL